LKCLQRLYAGTAEHTRAGWMLVLPDGTRIPYDDGRKKTLAERLAAPDVEDVFAQRYRPGPIRPVRTEDEDPGRVRIDALFAATYGKSQASVDVVPLRFFDQSPLVHRRVAPALARVVARLERAVARESTLRPYLTGIGGSFAWRNIAGTDRPSAHAYAAAVDINVERSDYWRWQKPAAPLRWRNRVPQAIVDAFEAEGFIWGGRWYHYDTMHFEYRPELLDPSCYPN